MVLVRKICSKSGLWKFKSPVLPDEMKDSWSPLVYIGPILCILVAILGFFIYKRRQQKSQSRESVRCNPTNLLDETRKSLLQSSVKLETVAKHQNRPKS